MASIISYNVNGIRAAHKKGLYEWLAEEQPDVLCLQEIKALPEQLTKAQLHPEGYHTYWYPAEKKGYSGVAIFSKEKPQEVTYGMGIPAYDEEGRMIRADFPDFSVISVYFPSGTSGDHRQAVKEAFLKDFGVYTQELRETRPNLIITGDYNIAHTPIDIHDPVRNKKTTGFLPHERAWVSDFLDQGYIDAFREFEQEGGHYSWWSYRAQARAKNKGWRIDYHMVTDSLRERLAGYEILSDVHHSDHCPIKLLLN